MPPITTDPGSCLASTERPSAFHRAWPWFLAAILVGLVCLAIPWDRLPSAEEAAAWLRPHRDAWYAIPVSLLAFVVLGCLFVPVLGMSAVAGVVFGPWLGSACALVGSLLCAAVGFALGRWKRDAVVRRFGERMRRFDRNLGRNGVVAVYLVRKIPAPFLIVNMMIGASRVRFVDFMIGTLLGMGVLVVILATAGAQLGDGFQPWSLAAMLVSLSIALIVNHVVKRRRDPEGES